jgi:hypothetical protein
MHRDLAAVALLVLLALAGCRTTLLDVMERDTLVALPYPAPRGRCFLGVVCAKDSPDDAIGLRIQRVLAESPAEEWGLRPGDEIRRIDTTIVRTAQDLNLALCDTLPEKYDIVISTGGEERTISKVSRVGWDARALHVFGRFKDLSRKNDATFTIPVLFYYEHMTIPAESFRALTGLAVTDAVTYFRDTAIGDALGIVTLWRSEHTYLNGAWRLSLVVHIYDSTTNDVLKDLVAPGEERLEVF